MSALLIAFGGVLPWVTAEGEVGSASPLAVALTFFAAVGVTAATALRQRDALRLLGLAAAVFALAARHSLGVLLLSAEAAETGTVSVTSGLSLIMLGAVGLFVASWLPAPHPVANAAADAQS